MSARRLLVLPFLATIAVAAFAPAHAVGDTQSQLDGVNSTADRLRSGIAADSQGIQRYQPRLDDLQARLSGVQASLDEQESRLTTVQSDLRGARARAATLNAQLVRDRKLLADQLVAQYKSPQATLVGVVLHAHGFAEFLETASSLSRIQRRNAEITRQVGVSQKAVEVEKAHLVDVESQQRTQTAAVLSERDQIAQLRQRILGQQSVYVRSRASKRAQLQRLAARRQSLEKRLNQLQASATDYAGSVPSITGGYAAHGGAYGFFPAPGTNYSVGNEPSLASHLDALGKALHLHLIGLSGYRTPQHSVEVGGFSDDPHTHGLASDTPGVEGVSEATLNRFGLTRPFGGAAEADHIQLAG